MADFDLASNVLPKLGTAAGATLDSTVFTAVLDTKEFGSVMALAVTVNAIAYSAVAWLWTECETSGGSYTNVAAANVIVPLPKNMADTSKVFHSGCRSKLRYVKATCTATGGGGGQITGLLGHPDSGPVFQSANYDQWSA